MSTTSTNIQTSMRLLSRRELDSGSLMSADNTLVQHSREAESDEQPEEDPVILEFIANLKLDKFCETATACRNGISSRAGKQIIGGFNIVQELIFEDGAVWLARIPAPNCFQPDECMLSYVAVLKYIKKRTKIPVPEVYYRALESDPGNLTGKTFLLMERLPGHELLWLETHYSDDESVTESDEGIRGTDYNAASDDHDGEDRARTTKAGGLITESADTCASVSLISERSAAQVNDKDTRSEGSDNSERWNEYELRMAAKVHEQLTDIIIDLASLTFDRIGSLREDTDGEFKVSELITPNSTAHPEERTKAFKNLAPEHRGPFFSVADMYHASCMLGKAHAEIDPEEEAPRDTIEDFEVLDTMRHHFRIDEYEEGPFVFFHDDLTARNILVDDDFNITGIINFPGTTASVPSLCVYPWLFYDNPSGPIGNRDLFYETFTTRDSANSTSHLASKEIRKKLLDSSSDRHDYELSLRGVYTPLTLPPLYEKIYGVPYRADK